MGRPSKLTAATTAAICDVIAAGGTRTIAARAAGVHPDTLSGWLRRAAQEDTETTLEADDYTLRALRALAKTAHVPGYGRLRKADFLDSVRGRARAWGHLLYPARPWFWCARRDGYRASGGERR